MYAVGRVLTDGSRLAPALAGWRKHLADDVRRARQWLPAGNSLPVEEWQTRHGRLLALLWLHVALLPVLGIARGFPAEHVLLEGAVIALFAGCAAFARLGRPWRSAAVATGLISCSALLVHLSEGLIEAHFHFFVVILLLALYEEWVPFLIAVAYVVAHHGIVGTVAPEYVYNHPDALANPWRWAFVHGAFVAAAGAAGVMAWRLNELSRAHVAEARAQAVRSEEANELKSRFVAMTSHELRTPLTSICGFATTLTRRWPDMDDDVKHDLVGVIESQSARLRILIDDLLLLSQLDHAAVPVRPAPTRVSDVVSRALVGVAPEESLVLDVPPTLTAVVDAKHLAQIVVNLVTNADKYGRPPIVVTARSDHGALELMVDDAGDGVPAWFVPRLFEPFGRADDEVSGMGSGLGLAVVRGLAVASGGSVKFEPLRPSGSRFRVRLPNLAENGDGARLN